MGEAAGDLHQLYYWPGIPGRGELVRLVLEEAGVPYVDVAREPASRGGGMAAIERLLAGEGEGALPFAPPVLKVGALVVAQTAHINHFVACRSGLAPSDEAGRLAALQHALTLADLVMEAHDVHHPVGVSLYYEDQKDEARRRAAVFRDERMPKFLGYFERVLSRSGEGLVGAHSYVDLMLFQVLEGLAYAFPNAFGRVGPQVPRIAALRERVAKRPRIAAYLASDRRTPFNEHGIFRHYPELDPSE
ncbi:MAG: glutathione S-transferase [Myxococcota bacterium]